MRGFEPTALTDDGTEDLTDGVGIERRLRLARQMIEEPRLAHWVVDGEILLAFLVTDAEHDVETLTNEGQDLMVDGVDLVS